MLQKIKNIENKKHRETKGVEVSKNLKDIQRIVSWEIQILQSIFNNIYTSVMTTSYGIKLKHFTKIVWVDHETKGCIVLG